MPSFKTSEEQQRSTWIAQIAKQQWTRLLFGVFMSLLSVALLLLNPWPLKILIDSVFGQVPAPFFPTLTGTFTLLCLVAGSYVVIYIVSGLLDTVDAYLTTLFTNQLSIHLQQEFFRHILNLPLEEQQKIDSGDYVYRLNEQADNLPVLLFSTLVSVVASVFTILAAILVLARLNWQMALISVLVVPLLYFSIRYFTHRIEHESDQIATETGKIYNLSTESINNATLLKSFNRQEYETKKFGELLSSRAKKSQWLTFLNGSFEYTNNVFTAAGVATVLVIGGYKAFHHEITVGDLLIFVTYMSYLYSPIETILSSISSSKLLMSGIKQVYAIRKIPDETMLNTGGEAPTEPVRGHIVFRDVSLQRSGKQILDHVSLEILPGQKVALVGPSGGGKSSLLSLLLRFIQPTSGLIYLDEKEVTSIDLAKLRSQFAFVAQDSDLMTGTIRENIGFAIPEEEFDIPDILMAAEAASALGFINKLPGGIDAIVGEGGHNLSGGQKQRIAIARAFVKNAPMLLLDEPTSALDRASGSKIISAIQKLMEGKTVLMATHELSLLKLVDVIYLIDEGMVTRVESIDKLEEYFNTLKAIPENNLGIKVW